MNEKKPVRINPTIILGIALIVVGILVVVGQILNISLGRFLWPFFIIVPGAIALWGGFRSQNPAGEGLMILGSLVSITGLLLLFQSITTLWATWAYAWALIAPTGVGVAELLWGNKTNNQAKRSTGFTLIRIGMIIFFVGLVFFEMILHISGFGFGYIPLAVVLLIAGISLIVISFVKTRKAG
jgi:uncharacterized membrane protein YiaA